MRLFSVLLLSALTCLAACTDKGPGPIATQGGFSNPRQDTLVQTGSGYFVENRTLNRSTPAASVLIAFPAIREFPDSHVMDRVNQAIADSVSSLADRFLAEAPELEEAVPSMNRDLTLEYVVTLKNSKLLSIVFAGSSYYSGAMHPVGGSICYTFDLLSGDILPLEQIFKPDSSYLNALSEHVRAVLLDGDNEERLADRDWFEEGTAPESVNFSDFSLTNEGILFQFDSYTLAPYSVGSFEALVPYRKIESLIRPEILRGVRLNSK